MLYGTGLCLDSAGCACRTLIGVTVAKEPRARMRLKTKLLALFAAISVLIVLILGGITYNRLWNERLALIQESISQQLQDFDFSLRNFFAEVEGDVSALANNALVRTRDDSQFTSFLQADEKTFKYNYTEQEQAIIQVFNAHRLTHPYVSSVYMGRENGTFVRSHPREIPTRYDPRERPWYLLAKAEPKGVAETDAYPALTTKDVNIGVVKALVDESGRVYGVVGIDVTVANLTDYILSFKIRPAGAIFLVDRNGVVLASQENGLQGKNIAEYSPALPPLLTTGAARVTALDIRGQKHFLFQQQSAERAWTIAVLVPTADIAREIRGPVLWTILSLSAGLLLLSVLTLSGVHLFVVHPLRKLTLETDFITRTGNLERRVDIPSRDELGDLANSYNEMISTLGQSQRSLRETEKDLTEYRDHLEELVAQRTRELQSTLEELAVERDRAEAADRTKSAFLATMSHELRTPLNSIIGFTGIILQGLAGPLNAEQHKQLEMVRNSSRHLLALINDVLDISKIEAGQLQVSSEPFDLRASIDKVVGIVRPMAEKKGLALRLELTPELGELVSDPRRVEQVLLNLLNNAIKFTDQGEVALTAEIVSGALPTADAAIRIAVADTGIGIKPEDLNKLFQPFRQIDTGLTRQHEGTGLGLAICRRLAELLGGEVHAASEWGKGSVFTFTLPVKGSREA